MKENEIKEICFMPNIFGVFPQNGVCGGEESVRDSYPAILDENFVNEATRHFKR